MRNVHLRSPRSFLEWCRHVEWHRYKLNVVKKNSLLSLHTVTINPFGSHNIHIVINCSDSLLTNIIRIVRPCVCCAGSLACISKVTEKIIQIFVVRHITGLECQILSHGDHVWTSTQVPQHNKYYTYLKVWYNVGLPGRNLQGSMHLQMICFDLP